MAPWRELMRAHLNAGRTRSGPHPCHLPVALIRFPSNHAALANQHSRAVANARATAHPSALRRPGAQHTSQRIRAATSPRRYGRATRVPHRPGGWLAISAGTLPARPSRRIAQSAVNPSHMYRLLVPKGDRRVEQLQGAAMAATSTGSTFRCRWRQGPGPQIPSPDDCHPLSGPGQAR